LIWQREPLLQLKHMVDIVATVPNIGETLSIASTFSLTLVGMKLSQIRPVFCSRF
jgi:hypothetical protein